MFNKDNKKFEIIEISQEAVFSIWENFLWKHRHNKKIRSMSSMLPDGNYDLDIYEKYRPHFLGACIHPSTDLCGVISGHSTSMDGYRFRGLYVFPKHRKKGLSKKLFKSLEECARKEGRSFVWSFPRKTSWFAYKAYGFELKSDWLQGEEFQNAFASKNLY